MAWPPIKKSAKQKSGLRLEVREKNRYRQDRMETTTKKSSAVVENVSG